MGDRPERPRDLAHTVGAQAARKLRARREARHGLWFGLGMMGLVGWSVVLPTLLGAALGVWLERRYPVGFSWTLSMLVVGLAVGCMNAGYWVRREALALGETPEDEDG